MARFKSGLKGGKAIAAVALTLGMNVSTIAPAVMAPFAIAPAASAQTVRFPDVSSNHWAKSYIDALVSQGVLAGFPDGTFRPDAPVTRAQFSSMIQAVYSKSPVRGSTTFADVSNNHWAKNSIQNAYKMGFLSGYPGNIFAPEQNIPREQVLVSLANGLNYQSNAAPSEVLGIYSDQGSISNFARPAIAAATEKGMVVNYPSLSFLNPGRNATRAEVAAFLYQALRSEGRVGAVNSPYIARYNATPQNYRLSAGTNLPVTYARDQIVLMPEDTVPVSFVTASNITTPNGQVLIPRGSQVEGEFRPVDSNSTQFYAQKLIAPDGSERAIAAKSAIIETNQTIRKNSANWGRLARNAAIGTAAAAAISAVTGDRVIATEDLLMGTAAGGIFSLAQRFLGRNSVDVIVVEPETNLNVTLDEDIVITP
ncbi:MAG: S-layer homology domain-containing protein [Cyanobacteria bacterium P01_C01_bin.89]